MATSTTRYLKKKKDDYYGHPLSFLGRDLLKFAFSAKTMATSTIRYCYKKEEDDYGRSFPSPPPLLSTRGGG